MEVRILITINHPEGEISKHFNPTKDGTNKRAIELAVSYLESLKDRVKS